MASRKTTKKAAQKTKSKGTKGNTNDRKKTSPKKKK